MPALKPVDKGDEKQIPECRAQWKWGDKIFDARPCPSVFPELRKACRPPLPYTNKRQLKWSEEGTPESEAAHRGAG